MQFIVQLLFEAVRHLSHHHLPIQQNKRDYFPQFYFNFVFHVEFIDVGKPARALDTLQEVFRNKKFTYTWSESVIEPIMFKYLDLCVELKKSHIAKEGLFQYRNMFQLVSNNNR